MSLVKLSDGMLARVAAVAMMALAFGGAAVAATPPAQPKSGPGATGDLDAEIVKRFVGNAASATYVYHLKGVASEARPVAIVLHAWGAVNPQIYGGWIDHLARRGYLVLFPGFQNVGRTRPPEATAAAAALVKSALAALATDPEARPDLSRVAYIGHSAGVGIAANLAATAKTQGLPEPRLVFALMAGGVASDAKSRGIVLEDLAGIPATTALVTIIGDREFQAADRTSRRVLREASTVPPNRKLFMRAGSDDHGFPTLSATLSSPASVKDGYDSAALKLPPEPPLDPKAPRAVRPKWSADMVLSGEQTVLLQQLQRNGIDTLDYLAFWRTFDMAAAAAFAGTDMATVRADPTFLDMGRWSDGWPVRRLSAEMPRAEAPKPAVAAAPARNEAKLPVTRRRETRSR